MRKLGTRLLVCTAAALATGLTARASAEEPAAPPPPAPAKAGCANEAGSPPSGWQSGAAWQCHTEAMAAAETDAYEECSADAEAAIDLESHFETRELLARCLKARGKYYKAHAVETALARDAEAAHDKAVAEAAARRAAELKDAMPVLKLMVPDGTSDFVVEVDDRKLPAEALGRGMFLDPGKHHVLATGKLDGVDGVFDETLDLKPSQPAITLWLKLTPNKPEWATDREAECMKKAKSAEEAAACVGGKDEGRALDVRMATEVAAYHDSMDVDVISPVASFGLEQVIDGWGLGASFLVDVVTAASADIVATASPHWTEVRVAPEVHGHVRLDPVDISLAASLSDEPDYLATTVGGGLTIDMAQKNVTLGLLYQYSHDISGRTETPFSVYGNIIDRHAPTASLGLVLDKATFGQASFTYVYEGGDASKPYRHIPMFAPDVAPKITPGLGVDSVNLARLPMRPLEQLPGARMRFAGALLLAHRFAGSTLRLSERLYRDDWGTNATTTDLIYFIDIVKEVRIWPHLRVHAQDAANFYELAYVAKPSASGPVIPALRTGDRELGPLIGVTAGGGLHFDIGTGEVVGLTLSGNAIYTRFLDHLYVKHRWGAFGALTLEVLLE